MAVQVHSYVRIQVLDFLPNYEHRNLRSDPHQSCLVVALRPDGRRQNENRKWRKSMCWGLHMYANIIFIYVYVSECAYVRLNV